MRKNKLTEYGVKIKLKLLELDRSQEWLIAEVNKRVTITLSSSYLNRIMTGRVENSQAVPVINDILGIAS